MDMNNPEEQQSFDDRDVDEYDQQSTEESSSASGSVGEGSAATVLGDASRRNCNDVGLAARLRDLFVGGGDSEGDLLMQRSNQEGTVMMWLQALDMQVMGACRADERLKPLLKLNVSSGVAEDRLLSHLSQHFEPSEVGMLARCLCIPLVSIRVGKINKQGTLLIPTSARGNLTLSLLPTSDMRMSFIADDGHVERLSTLRNVSDCSAVVIEGIAADNSGRSFMIRVPSNEPFYFWCSEKSRLLGNELLEKMKNLLERKPSLAELTGISDSRLQCFVAHLRTYLVGSNTQVNNGLLVSSASASTTSFGPDEVCRISQSASLASKPSRARSCSIQGSLSPRPSSFKEGPPRNLASLRTVVKEKLRRRGEGGGLSCVENLESLSHSLPICGDASGSNQSENFKLPTISIKTCQFPSSGGLEPESAGKASEMPSLSSAAQIPPIVSPLFSPYYCWCPPVASSLQYTVTPPQSTVTESFTLPPLSSLLAGSASRSSSSFLTLAPTLNLAEIPPFLPEPLVRIPLSMPSSQQIPTFTPLMCDPIVHIPVIDICSSGQAYLVSAGPAMTATIPPLCQTLVSPLIQESESMAEKSARDTLRLLISGSSQLPSVLANSDGNQNMLAGGSRGLYGGVTDVNNAIANSIAAMGLVSLSERSGVVMRCRLDQGDLVDLLEDPVDSGGTCSKEENPGFSDVGKGNSY